jgi:hypothetical protein
MVIVLKDGEFTPVIEQQDALGLARRTAAGTGPRGPFVEFDAVSAMKSEYGLWFERERRAFPPICEPGASECKKLKP